MKKLTDKLQANEIDFDIMGCGIEETVHFTVGKANFTAYNDGEERFVIEADTTVDGSTEELGCKSYKRLTYLISFITEMKRIAFELHEEKKEEEEDINESPIENAEKESIKVDCEMLINENVIAKNIGIETFIQSLFVEQWAKESNYNLADFVYQLVLAYNEISPIVTPIAKKVTPAKVKKLTKQEMYHNAHLMFANVQFATWVYNQLNDSRFGLDVEYRNNIINENEFWERKGAQDLLSHDATLLFSHIDTTLRHEHLHTRYIGLRSAYRKIITFFNSNFKPFENDLQPYIDRYEYNTGKKVTIAGGQN